MVLKPCAAEITKEGDSNKLEEDVADPMEVSSVAVSLCPAKRKAELELEKEEESDGEIEESNDGKAKIEERRDDWIIAAPEWDVDSFDGLEYYSSSGPELGSELSSEDQKLTPEEEEALKTYKIVKRQLIESKGFYMEPGIKLLFWFKGIYAPKLEKEMLPGKTAREYWEDMVHLCLKKYNQEKECNVEFVEVVRGLCCCGPRTKSYITFMAREKPDGPLVEYQTKCLVTVDGKRHPVLCRPAPTPKP